MTGFHFLSVFLAAAAFAPAQYLDFKDPSVPRSKDGKPKLDARAPKALDGKPDLTGLWLHEKTTLEEMRQIFGAEAIDSVVNTELISMEVDSVHKYGIFILADFPQQEAPFSPAGAELMEKNRAAADPSQVCMGAPTFPMIGLLSEPFKLVQAAKETVVLYEGGYQRQIYTDGRPLLKEINLPSYLGYSTGRWEKDVFVVETVGFNGKAPLDIFGTPHSERLHITERIHRRDFGHLDTSVTIDDPVVFTKPFTIKVSYVLQPDHDIWEAFCTENEKDREHLKTVVSVAGN